MIGRFIIECDPQYFEDARSAIAYLHDNPEHQDVVTSRTDMTVSMHAKRLKKSIRVRQVRP